MNYYTLNFSVESVGKYNFAHIELMSIKNCLLFLWQIIIFFVNCHPL